MAEEAKTIRELNHVLAGLRTELRLYVAGFVIALGVFGYFGTQTMNKLDDVASKIDVMTGKLDTIAADTSEIKGNTSLTLQMPATPTEGAFEGWIGVKASEEKSLLSEEAAKRLQDAWIYLPSRLATGD